MIERIDKDNYYLGIAESVLERSTCMRRHYGAILVKEDQIMGTGYNGSPRGESNCTDVEYCEREANNIPKGERYELCKALHAEHNAITSAGREKAIGGTLYIVGKEVAIADNRISYKGFANPAPCMMCRRVIKNAGLKRVVGRGIDGSVVELNIDEPTK